MKTKQYGITVTIEGDGARGLAQSDTAITVTDVTQLFEQAMKAYGFHPKGHLEWVDEDC